MRECSDYGRQSNLYCSTIAESSAFAGVHKSPCGSVVMNASSIRYNSSSDIVLPARDVTLGAF